MFQSSGTSGHRWYPFTQSDDSLWRLGGVSAASVNVARRSVNACDLGVVQRPATSAQLHRRQLHQKRPQRSCRQRNPLRALAGAASVRFGGICELIRSSRRQRLLNEQRAGDCVDNADQRPWLPYARSHTAPRKRGRSQRRLGMQRDRRAAASTRVRKQRLPRGWSRPTCSKRGCAAFGVVRPTKERHKMLAR